VNGVERQFYDYIARGAPFGPDDGTVARWVVVASLPFAPEIVIPTVRRFARLNLGMTAPYGFKPSFNQTFAVEESPTGWWVTPYHFGIDQGPVVLMIENYRSGLVRDIMRRCPAVIAGLRRARSPAAGLKTRDAQMSRQVEPFQPTPISVSLLPSRRRSRNTSIRTTTPPVRYG
jgi:hypothetical protein